MHPPGGGGQRFRRAGKGVSVRSPIEIQDKKGSFFHTSLLNHYIAEMIALMRTTSRARVVATIAAMFVGAVATASGQIFVTNYGNGSVRKYDLDTGSVINETFVSGLTNPQGLVVINGYLFAANDNIGRVGKYDAATGVAINTSFIGGLSTVKGLATADGYLFLSSSSALKKFDANTGELLATVETGIGSLWALAVSDGSIFATKGDRVIKYDAETLSPINSYFITGLTQAAGIAVSGSDLYVANSGNNTIGKYDTATGSAIDSTFISGGALSQPASLAYHDGRLYVVNQSSTSLAIYNADTGSLMDAAFISGLTSATGMTIYAVPEPSTWAAIIGLLALGFAAYKRHKR